MVEHLPIIWTTLFFITGLITHMHWTHDYKHTTLFNRVALWKLMYK